MYCKNKIVHTVQDGDTLYRLSRTYHTTVTELILGNPGANPYNLQAGMKLSICPGEGYAPTREEPQENSGQEPQESPVQEPQENPMQEGNAMEALRDMMRLAWLDAAFWKHMYMLIVDAQSGEERADSLHRENLNIKNVQARALHSLEEKLLETADGIADVFVGHWPAEAVRRLRDLLMEHTRLAGEIVRIMKSGNMENHDALIKEWYANADRIAALLGEQNPYFGGRETGSMLLRSLDMTHEAMEHQFNGEYEQGVATFEDLKKQVLELADHLAQGLMAH